MKTDLIIVLFEAANVRINTPKHVNAIAHPITFLLLPSFTSASQTNRSKDKKCMSNDDKRKGKRKKLQYQSVSANFLRFHHNN